MIEKEKIVHAEGLESDRINSSIEQPHYTGFQNLMIRAASKIVETLQSLIGELKLSREALEKSATAEKRKADALDNISSSLLGIHAVLINLTEHADNCSRSLAPLESEIHRIENGLKAVHLEHKDSFSV